MVDAVLPGVGGPGVDDRFFVVAVVVGEAAGGRDLVGRVQGRALEGRRVRVGVGGKAIDVLVEVVGLVAVVVDPVVPGVGGAGVDLVVYIVAVVDVEVASSGHSVGVVEGVAIGHGGAFEGVVVFVLVPVVVVGAVIVEAVVPGVGSRRVVAAVVVHAVVARELAGAADDVGDAAAAALVGAEVDVFGGNVAIEVGVVVVVSGTVGIDAVVPDVGAAGACVDLVVVVVAVVSRERADNLIRDVVGRALVGVVVGDFGRCISIGVLVEVVGTVAVVVDAVVPVVGGSGVDRVIDVVAVVDVEVARAADRGAGMRSLGVGDGCAGQSVAVLVLVPVVIVLAVVVEAVVPDLGRSRVVGGIALDAVVAGQVAGRRHQVCGIERGGLVGELAHVAVFDVAVVVLVEVVFVVAVLVDVVEPGVGRAGVDGAVFVVAVVGRKAAGARDHIGPVEGGALVGVVVVRLVGKGCIPVGILVVVVCFVAVVVDAVVPDVGGAGVDFVVFVVAVVGVEQAGSGDGARFVDGHRVAGGTVPCVSVSVGVPVVCLVAVLVDAVVPGLCGGGGRDRGVGVVAVVGIERAVHSNDGAVEGVAVVGLLCLRRDAIAVLVVVIVVPAVVVEAVVPDFRRAGVVVGIGFDAVVAADAGAGVDQVGGVGAAGLIRGGAKVGIVDVEVVVLVVVIVAFAVCVDAVVPDVIGPQARADGGVGVVAVRLGRNLRAVWIFAAGVFPVVVGRPRLALQHQQRHKVVGAAVEGHAVLVAVVVDVAAAVLVGAVVPGLVGARVDVFGCQPRRVDVAIRAVVDVAVVVAECRAQLEPAVILGDAVTVGAAVHAVTTRHEVAGGGLDVFLQLGALAIAIPVVLVVECGITGTVLIDAIVGSVECARVDLGCRQTARVVQDGPGACVVGVGVRVEGVDGGACVAIGTFFGVVPAVGEFGLTGVDRAVGNGHAVVVADVPETVAVGVSVDVGAAVCRLGGAVVVDAIVEDFVDIGVGHGTGVVVVAVGQVVVCEAGTVFFDVGGVGHGGAVVVGIAVGHDVGICRAVHPRAVLVGAVVEQLGGVGVDVFGSEATEVGIGVVIGMEVDAVAPQSAILVGNLVGAVAVAVLVEVVVSCAVLVGAVVPGVFGTRKHIARTKLVTTDVGEDHPVFEAVEVVWAGGVVPAVAAAFVHAGVRHAQRGLPHVVFRLYPSVAIEVVVVVVGAVGIDAVVGRVIGTGVDVGAGERAAVGARW